MIQEDYTSVTVMSQTTMSGQFQRPSYSEEEVRRKRDEAERRARRGEMDVMQEHTFTVLQMVSQPCVLYSGHCYIVQWTLLYCTVDNTILYSGHCYIVQWTLLYCTVDTALLYSGH